MYIKKAFRILKYFFIGFFVILLALFIYFVIAVQLSEPEIENTTVLQTPVEIVSQDFIICGKGRLQHNKYGLWELYLEGSPFELGVINGKLSTDLIERQEVAFVNQINKMIPSQGYLKFLKYFIAFFNRNLDNNIDDQYLQEIYGVSLSASDKFEFVGDNYRRILNYHGAHDIGHALQNMNLVGCTAFASWNEKSKDGEMIVGRNFDFHAGDEFAENKIVCFVKPDSGYRFMMITWGGMIGVVSGMNMQGLTVTLNAAKSDMPLNTATPVSILAREILQYASNIEEAYVIAQSRNTFVSEAFLIGSARDGKAVVIEKSPALTSLYETDTNYLILTNHFQSDAFKSSELSRENIEMNSTMYRYKRVQQLMDEYPEMDVNSTAAILRDQKGLDEENIGMGNEKAINQLIAHHSIIVKPEERLFWINTGPYQLGEYICYDLDSVFSKFPALKDTSILFEKELMLTADSFYFHQDYQDFVTYKRYYELIQDKIRAEQDTTFDDDEMIRANPHFFASYNALGNWYKYKNENAKAIQYFEEALKRDIPTQYERDAIKEKLENLKDE